MVLSILRSEMGTDSARVPPHLSRIFFSSFSSSDMRSHGFSPSFASFFADPPKFSPHVAATIAAPAARKSVDSSNGATGPRFDATAPASCPAPIATRLSPKYARPKIWERAAGGSARRVCSETSHASGACGWWRAAVGELRAELRAERIARRIAPQNCAAAAHGKEERGADAADEAAAEEERERRRARREHERQEAEAVRAALQRKMDEDQARLQAMAEEREQHLQALQEQLQENGLMGERWEEVHSLSN